MPTYKIQIGDTHYGIFVQSNSSEKLPENGIFLQHDNWQSSAGVIPNNLLLLAYI